MDLSTWHPLGMDAPLNAAPAALIAAASPLILGSHPSADPELHRVRPGVYTPRQAWADLTPWSRYLLRVHALRRTRPDAVFSHESAAGLWGLPLFGHPRHLHLFDSRRTRSLSYGDVRVHTSADPRRTQDADGIRLTTVADTVLDLARVLPPAFGLAVADAAARRHRITAAELQTMVETQRNERGRRRAIWVVSRMDRSAESVGESLSRAVIEWCGFPAPELQTEHRIGTRRYRSDFCWPEHRVIGESDGWAKYSGTDASDPLTAVREEKRREDALRRAGWRIARWDYAGALGGEPLRDALLSAGVPIVHASDQANLRAIGRNPRSE